MNTLAQPRSASRREFLRGAVRYAGLSVCAAISVWTLRQHFGLSAGQRCLNSSLCDGCAVLVKCSLPQALLTKRTSAGG